MNIAPFQLIPTSSVIIARPSISTPFVLRPDAIEYVDKDIQFVTQS